MPFLSSMRWLLGLEGVQFGGGYLLPGFGLLGGERERGKKGGNDGE
jgi:hypothetical protein